MNDVQRLRRREWPPTAARLVVEEGMEYGPAKRKARGHCSAATARAPRRLPEQRPARGRGARVPSRCSAPTPSRPNWRRCAQVALRGWSGWRRSRPHLTGAVWRGTATRLTRAPRSLLRRPEGGRDRACSTWASTTRSASTPGPARRAGRRAARRWRRARRSASASTVHLTVLDHDDLRGALKPDARGRSERGDAAALRRLMARADA